MASEIGYKNIQFVKITLMVIILICNPISWCFSQTSSQDYYGGSYNVNKNTSMEYKIKNFYFSQNFTYYEMLLIPNSSIDVNLTNGLDFRVIALDSNQSTDGLEQVYYQIVVNIPLLGKVHSRIFHNSIDIFPIPEASGLLTYTIIPTFTSQKNANSYLNHTVLSSINNLGVRGSPINQTPRKFDIKQNSTKTYVTISIFDELTLNNQTICYNWKTGWMSFYELDRYYSNYSLYASYRIVSYQESTIHKLFSFIIDNSIELSITGLILISIVLLDLNYIKYKKKTHIKSFSKYIKYQYSKFIKNSDRSDSEIDKILKVTEEIIKENESK